jgi:hypothetical protein
MDICHEAKRLRTPAKRRQGFARRSQGCYPPDDVPNSLHHWDPERFQDVHRVGAGNNATERVFDERRKQSLQRALPRLSIARLRGALLHAARIDRMIKGLAHGDLWDEFLVLALRLARR